MTPTTPSGAVPRGSPTSAATFVPSSRPVSAVAEATSTFETPGGAVLRVEIPAGAVTVETWAAPRVEVEVAPADDRSAAAAAQTHVSAKARGGRHEIGVRALRRDGRLGLALGRSPELAVTIRCPEGAELELTTQSADLEARGRLGAVSARSASGDATLEDAASLVFTSASGDLTAAAVDEGLTARSASGDVDVRSVGAAASVTTVSGDVRIGATGGAATVKTASGDVELGGAGGSVLVGTVSGDVEVAALPGLVLWVDARSVSGTMTSDFELGDAPAEGGQEAVEVRVRTVSGDVRIARSAAAAR